MIIRRIKDVTSTLSIRSAVILVNVIAFVMVAVLFVKAKPILDAKSIPHLLTSVAWHPLRGEFGFLPFILGTLEVTAIAMILSIPFCLLSSIYISEYAHKNVRGFVRLVVDILAGIPSVVYGLWGVIVVVPFVRNIGHMFGHQTTGYSLLAGSIILAIMVSPVIISISIEVLQTMPIEARESSLALGATRWETVKHVLMKSSLNGIAAAIVLGFARAFGETIAVLMVIGNVAKIPSSIFDPAYTLPALIANNYGEMMSIPLYDSALLFAALILMLVIGIFSLAANYTLSKIQKRAR